MRHGKPMAIRFISTGAEACNFTPALALLTKLKAVAVVANQGHLEASIVNAAKAMKAEVVIPGKSDRKKALSFDKNIYKERDLIEHLFYKIKYFRRIATRYNQTAFAFLRFT